MAELAELIAKVEALSGPDREVDLAIHRLAAPNADMFRRWNPAPIVDYSDVGTHWKWNAEWLSGGFSSVPFPKYSASLDAVIALVERELPGRVWEVIGNGGHPRDRPWAAIHGDFKQWNGTGSTPAICLLLALLRAKQQKATDAG